MIIVAYSQEIGRAGRDGKPAEAIIYYNKTDLGRSTVTNDMREFCTTDECRRQFLCKVFGSSISATGHHSCCDICERNCSCMTCAISDSEICEGNPSSHKIETENLIFSALTQYFNAVNHQISLSTLLDPVLLTGLTSKLATDIAGHYEFINSADTFCITYSHIDNTFLSVIHDILKALV